MAQSEEKTISAGRWAASISAALLLFVLVLPLANKASRSEVSEHAGQELEVGLEQQQDVLVAEQQLPSGNPGLAMDGVKLTMNRQQAAELLGVRLDPRHKTVINGQFWGTWTPQDVPVSFSGQMLSYQGRPLLQVEDSYAKLVEVLGEPEHDRGGWKLDFLFHDGGLDTLVQVIISEFRGQRTIREMELRPAWGSRFQQRSKRPIESILK